MIWDCFLSAANASCLALLSWSVAVLQLQAELCWPAVLPMLSGSLLGWIVCVALGAVLGAWQVFLCFLISLLTEKQLSCSV